jgi:hypothetical protein
MSASASPDLQPLDHGRHHRAASQSILESTKTLHDLKALLRKEKEESDKKRGKSERLIVNERLALYKQQEQAKKAQERVAMAALQAQVQRERLEQKERGRVNSKSSSCNFRPW